MENPRPVLSVKNVSMEFQVPLEGSSSLKEYLIKLFKGKNSSRTSALRVRFSNTSKLCSERIVLY